MIGSSAPQLPTSLDLGARPRSVPHPVSLWAVDALAQGACAHALAPEVLDEEERRRAAAFHRDVDRRTYVVAHVALRVLLGIRLATAAGAVPLVRETCPTCEGPHGRPAVAGGAVHFSLSHSGDLALIAIAGTPVGVDVEQLPQPELVGEVSASLHPAETAELAAMSEQERPLAFARAWSRKESYLKGIGTGLSRDPGLDHVGAGPSPAAGPAGWTIADVTVPDGYAAAVAVRSVAVRPAVATREAAR